MKLRWRRFLLSVGSVAVTVVAADLVMRAVGYVPTLSHDWLLRSNRLPNEDTITITPKFLDKTYYEVSPTLETIVTLGDSFTNGHPVAEQDTYPAVMARLLARQGWEVNTINLGLGDSGPDQQLRLLKRYLLPRLQPDVVVWAFYTNDVRDNIRKAVYGIESDTLVPLDASEHWVNIRQRVHRSIPLPNSVKRSSPILRLVYKALEIRGRRALNGDTRADRKNWSAAKIRLAIEELERLATVGDFETYYVLIARQSMYLANVDSANPDAEDSYVILHQILSGRSDFVDAWFGDQEASSRVPDGEGAPTSSEVGLFADDARDGNQLGDRHFNETGYWLLADAVARRLLEDRKP